MGAYDIAVFVGGPLVILFVAPWLAQRAIAAQDRRDRDQPPASS